jgi:hypothetical protein
MITRDLANQIASEWQVANDMHASSIRQFEAMVRAALLVTRVQVQMAGAGKSHWDYSGVAEKVLTAPDGQGAGDGQYDAGYLRVVQAMWASYTVWLATPIEVTVNGQPVKLDKRPIDIIMRAPQLAGAPAASVEEEV